MRLTATFAAALPASAATLIVLSCPDARACGGLFCNRATAPVPPEQSAERIVFVMNPPGWGEAPEGLNTITTSSTATTSVPAPPTEGPSVDAYIEIRYQGAAESFAWVVPLLEAPTVIGTAKGEIFEIDRLTAPRFEFTYITRTESGAAQRRTTTVQEGGGSCGASYDSSSTSYSSDSGSAMEAHAMAAEPEVLVIGQERVGPYEVAVIRGERGALLQAWLEDHDYAIPENAAPLLDQYAREGKTFAAFRLSDGRGVGAIEPVVIRVPGTEPCIPLRLTPVAAAPFVAVTAFVFGEGRARSTSYGEAFVNDTAVRPLSPTTTDYRGQLRVAVAAFQGLAFVTELAGRPSTRSAPLLSKILDRLPFVTRLSTSMTPGEMSRDPLFTVDPDDHREVEREREVDISFDFAAIARLGETPALPAPPAQQPQPQPEQQEPAPRQDRTSQQQPQPRNGSDACGCSLAHLAPRGMAGTLLVLALLLTRRRARSRSP